MPDAVAPAPAAPVATAQPNGGAPVAKTEAAPEPRYKLTVDGKEGEFTRREVEKFAGKGAFADKLIKQAKEALAAAAAKREKDAEDDSVWQDDAKLEEYLAKKGADLDRLARRRLEQRVKAEQMTPEQRDAADKARENDQLKAEIKKRDDDAKAARQAEATQVLQQRMESQLADAAERAGYPKNPDAFDAVREVIREWKRLQLPWDPERIIATAQENIDRSFDDLRGRVTKGLTGKALADRLGEDVVKEIIRYRTELLRNGGLRPAPITQAPQAKKEDAGWLSPHDLQNKFRGGR